MGNCIPTRRHKKTEGEKEIGMHALQRHRRRPFNAFY